MRIGDGLCPECGGETAWRSGRGFVPEGLDDSDLPPIYEESCSQCDWETTDPGRQSETLSTGKNQANRERKDQTEKKRDRYQ